jgi:hypothetical protein
MMMVIVMVTMMMLTFANIFPFQRINRECMERMRFDAFTH